MSDVTIPSYRIARERSGPSWRMLAFAGGLLAAVAAAGAVSWSLSESGPRTVPVVEAESRPLKVRPENPGGLVVPNTDQLVLEPPAVRRAAEREQASGARLAPPPEAPQLERLRREAAPAQPAPAAETPAPPPAPSPAVAELPPVAAPPAAPMPAAPERAAALPPPVPERPAAPPVVAAGRAQVQLGALASEEAARSEWARLQRRVPELAGRQPLVIRLDRGEGQAPLWRLRTGGLADMEAARALCDAVRAQGGACMPIGG